MEWRSLWSALALTPLSNSSIDRGIGKRRQSQGAPKAPPAWFMRTLQLSGWIALDITGEYFSAHGVPIGAESERWQVVGLPLRARLFSSHLESPRVESAAMRKKIYPWIILLAVLSAGILCIPERPGLRRKARTAIVKLKLKLDRVRYGPSSKCAFWKRIRFRLARSRTARRLSRRWERSGNRRTRFGSLIKTNTCHANTASFVRPGMKIRLRFQYWFLKEGLNETDFPLSW